MNFFDTHCHLDDKVYDNDIKEVINRAHDAGVDEVMIVGINKKSSIKAVEITKTCNGLYASVGVHPHDSKNCSEKTLKFLSGLAKNQNVRAWGEIGLDFNRMYSPIKDQEKWFVRQLEIAGGLNLPVIFHERESRGRFFEILNAHGSQVKKGVVHCFSGNEAELKQYLEFGLYIGITGVLTIKGRGADLRKLAPLIPVDRILVETDAPYLTPAPEKNRTRRNEPAFVRSVLLKLAQVREEDPEQLSCEVLKNSRRFYDLS